MHTQNYVVSFENDHGQATYVQGTRDIDAIQTHVDFINQKLLQQKKGIRSAMQEVTLLTRAQENIQLVPGLITKIDLLEEIPAFYMVPCHLAR